jgi:putative phage-type endonuclease
MTAPQLSPEWFAARKNRITGSMVGAILGLSPHMSRDDAMRVMVRAAHDAPSEFTGNVATEWGNAMEAMAIQAYEMESCQDTAVVGFVPYEDWLGASPDRLVADKGLLEVKCPYGLRKDEAPAFKKLEDQPHYYAQIQIELLCTGREWCHFWQWTPQDGKLEMALPDPDWLNVNLPVLRQFYAEFLHERDNNAEAHLEAARRIIDTPEALKMVAEWDELTEQAERVAERRKDLLDAIVSMADGKNALFAGRKLTLTKKQGAVSYASIVKEKLPDLPLGPWRGKDSESWGLR